MTPRIKPCPFCGGTRFIITGRGNFNFNVTKYGSATVSIACRDCNGEKYEHTSASNDYDERIAILIEGWNTRAGK